jgi:hypothetical protein
MIGCDMCGQDRIWALIDVDRTGHGMAGMLNVDRTGPDRL